MSAVADVYFELEPLGATTIAISTDSVYAHKIFHDISPRAHKVQYPMLADRTGRVAQAYGVLDPVRGAANRATFIIDPKGRIRYYLVHPHEVGRNVPEIIRTLKGLQYADATGEGVPAGWVPGMPGIKRIFSKIGEY